MYVCILQINMISFLFLRDIKPEKLYLDIHLTFIISILKVGKPDLSRVKQHVQIIWLVRSRARLEWLCT